MLTFDCLALVFTIEESSSTLLVVGGGGGGGHGIGTREKGAGGVREEGKEEVESGRNIFKIHNSS